MNAMISKVVTGCQKRGIELSAEEKYVQAGDVRRRVVQFSDKKTGNTVIVPDRFLDDCSDGSVTFITNYIIKKIK